MPILHRCEQYSSEYDDLKFGIATSSNFAKIITPSGFSTTDNGMGYAYHLISERCLGRKVDTYQSGWMERGLMLESDAAEFYELQRNVTVDKIGFITDDAGKLGCTPDRLIGDKKLLEIKVPKPQTQIEYLVTGKLDLKYKPQLQGQLFVSGREVVDVISYHPELPPCIIEVERDEEFIACLDKLLSRFNNYIDKVMDKISVMTNQPYKKGVTHGYTSLPL